MLCLNNDNLKEMCCSYILFLEFGVGVGEVGWDDWSVVGLAVSCSSLF